MGCSNEYQKPREREIESRLVAEHIVYLFTELAKTGVDVTIPDYVLKAVDYVYGDESLCDDMTKLLCETIDTSSVHDTHTIIYNGRNKKSRALADWWENHQDWDAKCKKEEAQLAIDEEEREALMRTLSPRQRALLNL